MNRTWKTVRVFISSTFRDMQAERDHLVRFVFPRLREELLKRRIHLVDVDLRWGVTSEQDSLQVCKEIIDECRPRFLCMLGGRYGWTPPGREESITAAEVRHGVLDRVGQHGYAFFYFRDPRVTDSIPEEAARSAGYREFPQPDEIAQLGPQEAREMARRRSVKLRLLKRAIGKAGLRPYVYQAKWNDQERRLAGLEAFGQRVYDDLLHSIDDEFGAQPPAQLDEFAEENAAMEAFVEERSERFVLGSRETVLKELLAHAGATGGNGYVCLTGAPGSGKSALLAHLYKTLISPPLPFQSAIRDLKSAIVVPHFVGASPGSTDVRRTLRRLCHELKAGCPDITAEIPDDPETLRVTFPDFLRQACARRRVVILLDAVNQFDAASHSAGLHWLPEDLPENVRVILSLQSAARSDVRSPAFMRSQATEPPEGGTINPALDELRRRRNPPKEVELRPLTADDGEAIIKEFLHRYRKTMTDTQRAALLSKADAGTPLYLLASLEELRTLGAFEEITGRIAELPPTTHDLFAWILERLENDDGFRDAAGRRVGHELVSRFAALLGASRYGLSQRELADLLAPGDAKADPPIEPDPQGNVAALLHLLRPYLMRRGELLDFYHGQFRAAAEGTWLKTDAQRHTTHLALADYFERQPANLRKAIELPWQLDHAGQWERLRGVLSDLDFLEVVWETDRHEVLGYWQNVRRGLHIRSCNILRFDYRQYVQDGRSLLALAELLAELGDREVAAHAFDAAVQRLRHAGPDSRLVRALEGRAGISVARREFAAARVEYNETAALYRKHSDDRGVSRTLGNLAITWYEEDPRKAFDLLREQETIARRLGDYDSLQRSLGDQSVIQAGHFRDSEAAVRSAQEAVDVCEEYSLRGSAQQQRFNLAVIAYRAGHWDRSRTEAELETVRHGAEAMGLRPLLAACLGQQGQFLAECGHVRDALLKHRKAEILWRETEDVSGLIKCLSNEAILLGRGHQVHSARRKAEEALALMAKHGYAPQARANMSRYISRMLFVRQVIVVSLALGVLLLIVAVDAWLKGQSSLARPLTAAFGAIWLVVVGLLAAGRHLGRKCPHCKGRCFAYNDLLVCMRCGNVIYLAARGSGTGLG